MAIGMTLPGVIGFFKGLNTITEISNALALKSNILKTAELAIIEKGNTAKALETAIDNAKNMAQEKGIKLTREGIIQYLAEAGAIEVDKVATTGLTLSKATLTVAIKAATKAM